MGAQAGQSQFFMLVGANNYISTVVIICGFFLLVTASIGCTAAASKNEALAFIVREIYFGKKFYSYVFTFYVVWVHVYEYYADFYLSWYIYSHYHEYLF